MHSLYPSLAVQKWSKITTKWCQFQNEKPTKTQQKTNTHNPHPKTTPNKNKTQKGTWHDGSKKQWHQVLLNQQILHKNNKTTNKKSEPAIGRKIKASYDIRAEDIRRIAAFVSALPPPSAPESPFFLTLGTPAQQQCPPLNSTLAQRTKEEWARTLCENKAVAIIQGMQEGKPALIPKECEEILIAIVLDRPLAEAQRLVDDPERFFNEILDALDTHRNHPVLTQLLLDIAGASTASTASQPSGQQATPTMQFQ